MLEESKTKFWETILIAGLSALATGLANLIVEEIKERKKKKVPENEKKVLQGSIMAMHTAVNRGDAGSTPALTAKQCGKMAAEKENR